MADFLFNGPCEKCGSRDNKANYSDGSAWCWGCHAYFPPDGFKRLASRISKPKNRGVYVPDDSEPYYPYTALQWAKEYDLNDNDLRANNVLWSESQKLLIFPLFDNESELVAWQGRSFGDIHSKKWFGRGNLANVNSFKGPRTRSCVITEDVISAIKVGKSGTQALPIFGSHIAPRRLAVVKPMIDRLVIWLDADKIKEAHSACKKAQLCGIQSRTLYTALDPKCYSTKEIKEILDRC